jgi:hypothetical protein
MSHNPNWRMLRLDDIERRDRDIPVREHLDIHAVGINAYVAGEDGALISDHDESGPGQEELYIVLDGNATFEIDGDRSTRPRSRISSSGRSHDGRRPATGTILAVGATPGEAYQALDWGEAWRFHKDSRVAYGEQRYADALEAVRLELAQVPDHPGLNFNYACFARSRATRATRRSPTSATPSNFHRGSVKKCAETTTLQLFATTRGSSTLFASQLRAAGPAGSEEAARGAEGCHCRTEARGFLSSIGVRWVLVSVKPTEYVGHGRPSWCLLSPLE